jgi:hypothetical protein
VTIEPAPKRMKVVSSETTTTATTINNNHHASLNTDEEQSHGANATISSWWESGDARKLFAPCTVKYDFSECVKGIQVHSTVVERLASNWLADVYFRQFRDISVTYICL